MITELALSNFRGHTTKYNFGPGKNIIRGCNEAGKSTIKEAIAFAWLGTDSSGSKNPDHLITVGQDMAEVRLSTPKSALHRRKKRGSTSDVKISMPGLPDVKLSQTDLMNKIKLSPEVFMSSWQVGYFMKLKSEQRLKVLGEIARLDRKELLRTLMGRDVDLPPQVKLVNPKIDADGVAGIRRQLQNKAQSLQGSIAQIDAQLSSMKTSEIDPESYNKALAEVDAALEDWVLYDKLLAKFNADKARKEAAAAAGQTLLRAVEESKVFIQRADLEEKELKTRLEVLINEGTSAEARVEKLKTEIQAVTLPIPNRKRSKTEIGECPTCGQAVTQAHVDKLEVAYSTEVEVYNIEERRVADHNKPINSEIMATEAKMSALRKEYQETKAKLEVLSKNRVHTETQLKNLAQQLDKEKSSSQERVEAPVRPTSNRSELTAQRDKLKLELHDHQTAITQKQTLVQQKATQQKDLDGLANQILFYSGLEKSLLALPELETRRTLETVAIPGVKLSLQDGELVVENEQGVDYRSLSDGRCMKVDLGFCSAIKKAAGPAAPPWIFVDNADLMDGTVLFPPDTQLLIAEVDGDSKQVQIIQM